jgi:hypothetical protein
MNGDAMMKREDIERSLRALEHGARNALAALVGLVMLCASVVVYAV